MDLSSLTSQAFWMTGGGTSEIRNEDLERPLDSEVLVENHYSAVSLGTESLIWRGQVPCSEFERMKGPHQKGSFEFPIKYGYASVGVVRAGAPELRGKRVFVMHPHQTRFVVPKEDVIVLPTAVEASRAVLSANMETALNGIWDA